MQAKKQIHRTGLTFEELPEEVQIIGRCHFDGHVIPLHWFKQLTLKSGKPDLISLILLADIVYWYRPAVIKDDKTKAIQGYKVKFHDELLRRNYDDFEKLFGLSERQIRDGLVRLEAQGLIKRVFKTATTAKGKVSNVMYIKIYAHHIQHLIRRDDGTLGVGQVAKTISETAPINNQGNTPLLTFRATPICKNANTPVRLNVKYPGKSLEKQPLCLNKDLPINIQGNAPLLTFRETPICKNVNTWFPKCKDHIKNTKITSKITHSLSTISLSQESGNKDFPRDNEKKIILEKMLQMFAKIVMNNQPLTLLPERETRLAQVFSQQLNSKLENWKIVCHKIICSKFLMGETEKSNFKATLDWVLKENNATKILEGNYDSDRISISTHLTDQEALEQEIKKSNESKLMKELRLWLIRRFGVAEYMSWLRDLAFDRFDGQRLCLTATGRFMCEQIRVRFGFGIIDYLKQMYPQFVSFEIEPKNSITSSSNTHSTSEQK